MLLNEDLDSDVRAFLLDQLLVSLAVIDCLVFNVKPLSVRSDSPTQNQALVTFSSAWERDCAAS